MIQGTILRIAAVAIGLAGLAAPTARANVTTTGSTVDWGTSISVGYSADGALTIDGGTQYSRTSGFLGSNSGWLGTATIIGPGSQWTNSDSLIVGDDGKGVLNIQSGGQVSSSYGCLGCFWGSTGTATVAGAGSTWTIGGSGSGSGELDIGYWASGTLNIQSDGQISSKYGYLGYQTGSFGSATVTGPGSKWTNSSHLYVGYNGSGTLSIQAGGQVSSGSGSVAGAAGTASTATVTGAGSMWTNSGNLSISGTLKIEAGGQVSSVGTGYVGYQSGAVGTATITGPDSTWTNNGALIVGRGGGGSLNIFAGGQVTSASGSIGFGIGAIGAASVTVAGSKWANTGKLDIGYYSNGTLTIQEGGQVNNTDGCLGYYSGSRGTASVTGAGATWANTGDLYVGQSGTATLTVADGGLVAVGGTLWASSGDLFGDGTISAAKGAVVDAALVFDSIHGTTSTGTFGTGGALNVHVDPTGILGVGYRGTGTLHIGEGVAVASASGYLGYKSASNGTATVAGAGSAWTNSCDLDVGFSGNGSLEVQSGGQVSNACGYIGYGAGSAGTVTVTGAGSTWANSGGLYVGNSGGGTLTVADGATVTASTLYGALGDLLGDGQITANGVVLDGSLAFEGSGETRRTFHFGSGGTLEVSFDGTGVLGVGHRGTGELRIAGGASVRSASRCLGNVAGSHGVATVTGAGSTWANSVLYVGNSGSGTLTVEAGGQLSSTDAHIGNSSGAFGTVTVAGAGSLWTSTGDLVIGDNYGHGTLNIEAGGQISGLSASIGKRPQGGVVPLVVVEGGPCFAWATVSGAGSTWANTGGLRVGDNTNGNLTIRDGGQVSNAWACIGNEFSSTGNVAVTGPGSAWTCTGNLLVGNSGFGRLNVADHGTVVAASLQVGSSSKIRLNVSGNDMIVLGDSTTAGSVTNNGAINLYADPFLAVGTYWPISAYPGQTLTWSGTGTYNAFGGTWDGVAHTFNVTADPTALDAGAVDDVSSGERLLFTDPASGKHAGAGFGTVTAGVTFSASPAGASELEALAAKAGFHGPVYTAWDFTTNLTSSEVLLSFDIGPGAGDLQIWRLYNGAWSACIPDMLTYDANGVVSFTTQSFSGYAVTAVPEPATLALLAVGGLG